MKGEVEDMRDMQKKERERERERDVSCEGSSYIENIRNVSHERNYAIT